MNPNQINQYLKNNNFHPSKKMGQNFLCNEQVAQSIVERINVEPFDVILEIGPGLGSLTQFILKTNKPVIAVELDKRLCEELRKTFAHNSNFTLVNNDILRVDLGNLLKQYKHPLVISNLPYVISSPTLTTFLNTPMLTTFYCMFQKEFVDRINGKPSSKDYNAFSVIMQTYTDVQQVMTVKPGNFIPEPGIDSVVVKITKKPIPLDNDFTRFIKLCFVSKRRTLINNLKNTYNIDKLEDWLVSNDVSLLARAEALSPQQLMALYLSLKD